MTKYREILRLTALGTITARHYSQHRCFAETVVKVQKRAREMHLSWPLDESLTDSALETLMFQQGIKGIPNKNGCRISTTSRRSCTATVSTRNSSGRSTRRNAASPAMSLSCIPSSVITSSRMSRSARATMHINRKPGEQIEVDWAGDPAQIIDPDTGEIIPVFLFVGVMTYSQYPFVEAFINEKQRAWITAHVHMYEYFGGVTRILGTR